MSCPLPPEVLDLIVDNLHNELRVLRTCCTVSESWVPRTRTHLFACVEFRLLRSPIESWMKGFPDPSKSPPLTLPGLSLLSRFDSTPLRVWMWAVGSAPSVASCTYACTSSVGVVIRPPRPILRIITLRQITPPLLCPWPALRGFRFRMFLPPSQGSRAIRS